MYYNDRYDREIEEARLIEKIASKLYVRGDISGESYRDMIGESKRIREHVSRKRTAEVLGTLTYFALKAWLND